MSIDEDVFSPVGQSPIRVGLELVASFPANTRFHDLVDAPDASPRLFVVDTRGRVFMVEDGQADDAPFLDLVGRSDFRSTAVRDGLRSLAFHPEAFADDPAAAGYGLFYTAHTAPLGSRPEDVRVFNGRRAENDPAFDLVLAEWRFDPETLIVDNASKREVFRVETANTPHAVGAIRFHPGAAPGDPDYGALYVPIGDLSNSSLNRNPGRPNGKFFRIDPLEQPDGEPYRVPDDNPFVGVPGVLPEVFASGARNPQTVFIDHQVGGLFLFADVGGERIEEINILAPGAHYGWPDREGPLVRQAGPVYDHLPSPLPADDPYQYPVTGYDHSATATSSDAIAVGAVIRGGPVPALDGKIVFSNFPDGSLFVADAGTFSAAIADGKVTSDEFVVPELLTDIQFEGASTTLLALLGSGGTRADARFGTDAAGNLYVFGKHNGQLYRFVPAEDAAVRFALNLVDTRTDTVVAALNDKAEIATDTPAAFRGVVATVEGGAGSVLLRLFDAEGRLVASTIDSRVPFTLFGDDGGGDYVDPWAPVPAGSYALTATAFAEAEAAGAIIGEASVSFEIRDAASGPRLVFSLVDTGSDVAVATLLDGARVDPGTAPARRGFAVELLDAAAGSLRIEMFDRNGALLAAAVDDGAPFALFGDHPTGDFAASPFAVLDDRYTLRATAYAEPGGIGEEIASDSVTFTLQEGTFVFSLIDTRTNAAVATLTDGAIVDIDVPANTRGLGVDLLGVNSEESMTLELFGADGALVFSATDSDVPYALFGNGDGGGFAPPPFAFAPDVYTLRARAFSENGALGEPLAGATITFTIAGTEIVFEGTELRDRLVGGSADQTFLGLGGNDLILARGGNDIIFGGPGDDRIYAGQGDDIIDGGPGFDRIWSGPGADTIFLRSAEGFDTIGDFEIGLDLIVVDLPGVGRDQLRVGVEGSAAVLDAEAGGQIVRLAILRDLAGADLDDLLGPPDREGLAVNPVPDFLGV